MLPPQGFTGTQESIMSNRGLWLEGGTTFPDRPTRWLAVCLAAGWVLLIAARNVQPGPAGPHGCSSDPWDFLPIGETVVPSTLVAIVEAHCADVRYAPGGWIELSHGGARVDVKLRRVAIAGSTYFQVAAIGGVEVPWQ